jgi:cytoskeleton protein RodZ
MLAAIEPTAGTAGPESRIIINVIDNAWVEIRDSEGQAVISRILKKGDRYFVPDEKGLVMDTGNVGVLEFIVDGTPLPPLGQAGDVKRSMPLDPDVLTAPAEEVVEQDPSELP